ncbi:MAG: hypothetical protein LBS31_00590 [Candidatus Adiutrix sp.]|jgi:hypothetical protein|nr:hypothetical protein [Candidatus Adiutrix sp.]
MTTLQKNIEISEDRRLRLDLTLPEGFPTGQAKVLVFISPDVETEPPASLPELAGSLKDSPNFAGDPMEIQRKIRSDVW